MKYSRKDVLVGVARLFMLLVVLFALIPVYADDDPDFLVTDLYIYHYDAWEPCHALAGTPFYNTSLDDGLLYYSNDDYWGWYEALSRIDADGWYGWINNGYRNRWYPAFVPPNINEHGNVGVFQGQFPHSNDVLGDWAGDYWVDYPCSEGSLWLEFTVENIMEEPVGTGVCDGLTQTLFPFVSVGVDVFFDMEPDITDEFGRTWWDYDDPNAGGEPDLGVIDVFPIHYIDETGSPNGVWPAFEYPYGTAFEAYSWVLCDQILGYTNPYQGVGAYDTDEHYSIVIDTLDYGCEKTYKVDLGEMFNALAEQCEEGFWLSPSILNWDCSGAYIKGVAPTMETVSCEYAGKVKYVQVYMKGDADDEAITLWSKPCDNCGDCPYVPYVEDIDKSGDVDMKDVVFVSRRLYSEPGDDWWDREADIHTDGEIDMKDLTTVSAEFWRRTGWGYTTFTVDGVDISTVVDDCTCSYAVHDCSVDTVLWLQGGNHVFEAPDTVEFSRTNDSGTFTDYYYFDEWYTDYVYCYSNPCTLNVSLTDFVTAVYCYNYTS